jgi:hypothetical protein
MPNISTDPQRRAAHGPAPSVPFQVAAALGVACAVMALLVPRAGHAYLDPGVASFAIQGIVGAIAAVAAGIAGYWRKVLALLKRKPAHRTSDGDLEPEA